MAGPVWSPGRRSPILAAATVGVAIESELLVHAATEATEALGLSTDVPRADHHPDHRQRRGACRRGDAVPEGPDRSGRSRSRSGRAPRSPCWWRRCWCSPGVLLGQDMNLVFRPFEVVALGLATIVVAIITLDGESHWFEGVQLLAVYAMVAVGAFFL